MNSVNTLGGAMPAIEFSEPSISHGNPEAWYVVQTKRHRERTALQYLNERDFVAYVPHMLQWPRPAVGSAVVPMFPGYLFVRCAMPNAFAQVSWTPGVKAFVRFAGAPASIDDGAIEYLRAREGPDGLIRCCTGIEESSEVRIIRGPFRGLTAVVEERLPARERVRVLMDLLQRSTVVELPERWIARV